MKNNKIKKAVLAVTLAASMTIPAATLSGSIMTVNAARAPFCRAPFCADTDNNGAINIDERQIVVSRSFFSTNEITMPVTTTAEGQITTIAPVSVEALSLGKITIEVSGNGLSSSALYKLNLNAQYSVNGKTNNITYTPNMVKSTSNNTFIVSYYSVINYGDNLSFTSVSLDGVSNINCTSAVFSPDSDSSNCLKLNVRPAEGEKLYIRIKNAPSMSIAKVEKWAKIICMYVNSLHNVTGATLDTIYMNFDNIQDSRFAGSACSANWYINEAMDKYGFVGFNVDTSDEEREQIAKGGDVLTWSVMHELAHSYCCGVAVNGRPLIFDSDYKFQDDYFTNARGLTAIQNCDNLRNTFIHFRRKFEDHSYLNYYEKYDTILTTISPWISNDINDPYRFFQFGAALTQTDWVKLESFFAADSDNVSSLNECSYVARMLNSYMGTNISLYNNDFLKLANTIRKLMVLENGSFNEDQFDSFLNGRFTPELLRIMVTKLGYTS